MRRTKPQPQAVAYERTAPQRRFFFARRLVLVMHQAQAQAATVSVSASWTGEWLAMEANDAVDAGNLSDT